MNSIINGLSLLILTTIISTFFLFVVKANPIAAQVIGFSTIIVLLYRILNKLEK